MRFANPYFLLLLLSLPFLLWFEKKKRRAVSLLFPALRHFQGFPASPSVKLMKIFSFVRYLVLVLVVLAFARPQSGYSRQEIVSHGIDIVLIIDTSPSMSFQDFYPKNRMEVAKKMAADFIQGRKYDRIGIVIFGSVALTQVPLSIDHNSLLHYLSRVAIGMTRTEGTAVGLGLGMGVRRLKESEGKTKIAILLTDGRNNTGEIDPITAARLAKNTDIKVYTIGIGSPNMPKEELDEETLQEIAKITGGQYFRADSPQALANIFKRIDDLEKSEIKIRNYAKYNDLYPYFIVPALFFLGFSAILGNTYFKKIP